MYVHHLHQRPMACDLSLSFSPSLHTQMFGLDLIGFLNVLMGPHILSQGSREGIINGQFGIIKEGCISKNGSNNLLPLLRRDILYIHGLHPFHYGTQLCTTYRALTTKVFIGCKQTVSLSIMSVEDHLPDHGRS